MTENFVPWDSLVKRDGASMTGFDAQPQFDLDAEIDIDAELKAFEDEERKRLGLEDKDHYVEGLFTDPTTADPTTTTILLSGLTMAQDYLVGGALSGLGYDVVNLDCPDKESLKFGKEFGNRGQCNPTYFTVGNLVKYLAYMRDHQGISTEDIVEKYVFLTAGSCGPCRFGMYVTEYRKALRDAGFEGFRVLLFQMNGGIKQASGDDHEEPKGLVFDPKFFISIGKALFTGDALNALYYRIKPYEAVEGAADQAMSDAKDIIYNALNDQTSMIVALYRARRVMGSVLVDKTRVKPKVGIIGEFWAMTTEGDGNYQMQKFLQGEGAEVDIQIVTAWVLFMVWEQMRDTKHRMKLRKDDDARKGLDGVDTTKKLVGVWAADKALRAWFSGISNMVGLHGFHIPNMDYVANISRDFYNNDLRGGEAHLEVGKVIMNVLQAKVNMTLSIKPFGCMPSSGVSDGVQSAITELYPEAIFLPIETTGDGAVNVYSRVQMMLFKAKQAAQKETDEALEYYGMSLEDVRKTTQRLPFVKSALFKPPHFHGSTSADMVEFIGAIRNPIKGVKRWLKHRNHKPTLRTPKHLAAERAASAKAA